MANEIEIGVTKIENIIEISSQPTDQIIDIGVTDNRDDVVLNITPSVIEININRGTTTAGLVTSVNTRIGDVVIDADDVGLGNVDNTGDFDKPISTDTQVALNSKADLINGLVPVYQLPSTSLFIMTGLAEGGLLTINGDNTKVDLAAGFGYIVNGHSNPDVPTATRVNWNAKIANTIPNLATQDTSYVSIDINGYLYFTNSPLNSTQRRNYIRLGALIHLNNTTLDYIDNKPTVSIEVGGQVQDILQVLGFRSLSGNRIAPVNGNLKIKKEAGTVFKSGSNFNNLVTQPHTFILPEQNPITFRYRTQTGVEGSDITDINPAIYDLNGSFTAMPSTATLASVQQIYIFQDGSIRIQPGQTVFTSLSEALLAINSNIFITENDISENGLYLGSIAITRNATVLNNIVSAIFVPSQGTTTNGSVPNAPLGYTPEDEANKQDSLAVDGTASKYPTVDAVKFALTTKADLVSGLVPQNQLPSYVDDVLEFNNLASFPASGEIGKIYIAIDSGKQYRWSGSAYIQITNGLIASTNDVPEGGSNLYFLVSRVLSTILTGLSTASTTVITAADTVLSALGKLQGQVSLKANDNSVVHLTGNETVNGIKTFTSPLRALSFRLNEDNNSGLYYGHTNKVVLANYVVGGGIDFETNGGDINMILDASANLSVVGTITGSNLSGTNTGDQTLSSLGAAPSSGSANYIQNGTSQQTANLNISGSGTFGLSVAASDGFVSNNATIAKYSLNLNGTETARIDNFQNDFRINNFHPTSKMTFNSNGEITFNTAGSSSFRVSTANVERLNISPIGTATFSSSVTATSHVTTGGTASQFVKGDGSLSAGYKVYTALLSQSGTSAPTATVLDNTLGGTVVWSRNTVGDYRATLSGAFTNNKTVTFVNQGATSPLADVRFNRQDISGCTLRTYTANTSTTVEGGYLINDLTMLEIRVYN
jgi:hypothetical protein